jgi:hypothetical protein
MNDWHENMERSCVMGTWSLEFKLAQADDVAFLIFESRRLTVLGAALRSFELPKSLELEVLERDPRRHWKNVLA